MLEIIDTSKEVIKIETNVPLSLEKIVVKTDSPIQIDLIDWEEAGLRIGVSVLGLGRGYFNEQPYADKETALREYQHVLAQVQNGNYSLELYKKGKLKLVLTDS